MDITSYLLGKNAGGGGAELQTKSATITQNGESTISPDEGYDGMSAVNLTVAVPEPTGTINITENGTVDVKNYASANVNVPGISTQISDLRSFAIDLRTEVATLIQTKCNDFLTAEQNTINSRTPLMNTSVTLYKPALAPSLYAIRKRIDSEVYNVIWATPMTGGNIITKGFKRDNSTIFSPAIVLTNTGYWYESTSSSSNYPFAYPSTPAMTAQNPIYLSNSCNSVQECIDGMINNTLTYTAYTTSTSGFNGDILVSNAFVCDGTSSASNTYMNDVLVPNIISINETFVDIA